MNTLHTGGGGGDDDDDSDKVGITIEHIIAGCSSLSESAYIRRCNQLAKIIHQQFAIKYKLHDGNTLLYYRHKPELVLEAANLIVYWDRSIITSKMVDFNRPDMVLFDRDREREKQHL